MTKKGHITFGSIDKILKFKHHASGPAIDNSLSAATGGGGRIEATLAFQMEAERRRAMGRAYSNIVPPR
ncbi:TPA: hypothetical protein HA274_05985 [Candidatus Bathyarchaeota archaeon]|nr:hypothetical protein [Candidatus Bathyarchaeota archaeon]